MEQKKDIILNLAKKYGQNTAENLSEIVRIKSLSLGEGDVQAVVMRQMRDAGFDAVRMDGLGNVIGSIGTGSRILAFDGHIDTVDVGNAANWNSDPFSGKIENGLVHGRGTTDQKGGVAAFITAGRILKEMGFDKDVTLLFVSSVIEEDCDGLCWKYLIDEEKIRPELVISTEPTNLAINRGQRGRMEIAVHFRGISAHGSAPERGKNAIYMAAKTCMELKKLNKRLITDKFLGKGSLTVSEIKSGSPSLCAVADYARIHIDRRLTKGETKETALEQIRNIVKDMDATVELLNYEETSFTGLKYGMEKYYPTWTIPKNHVAVKKAEKTFRDLFDKEPLVDKWTFSTNGVTIKGIYDIPVFGFGPGREEMAHAPNETTSVDDLIKASAFYAGFVCTYFGF